DELRNANLLVFANKQDLPNAMNAAEITEKLGLQAIKNIRWYIQATCATTGDGLYEVPIAFSSSHAISTQASDMASLLHQSVDGPHVSAVATISGTCPAVYPCRSFFSSLVSSRPCLNPLNLRNLSLCTTATATATTTTMQTHELDKTDIETYVIPGGTVYERFFECPLDYSQPQNGQTVRVFVRHIVPLGKESQMRELPFMLYLQGGPGFECRFPGSVKGGWHCTAIAEGYQILLIDQRGTGLSSPINADSLDARFATTAEKVEYVSQFRADNIVRDCEHIRKILCQDRADKDSKLALLGQS
ncbi:hypothetical protein LPJ71_011022, partial [Coemansia sp. S17]